MLQRSLGLKMKVELHKMCNTLQYSAILVKAPHENIETEYLKLGKTIRDEALFF